MASEVTPVPEQFNTVSAYLIVDNAQQAIEFYEKSLGAELVTQMLGPDGESTMHAELKIGDSIVMLSDENPALGAHSPKTLGGSPVSLFLYVDDAESLFARAVEAGCAVQMPMAKMFWGDLFGKVTDPFGHHWSFATRVEVVHPEEMDTRIQAMYAEMAAGDGCEGEAS